MSGYTERGDCGVVSPDMADPCRKERGHLGPHWALCGEMWERTTPATWRGGDETPPDGTIVAADNLSPWILEEGRWRCGTGSRSISCDVNQLTRPCHVLRWGWTV